VVGVFTRWLAGSAFRRTIAAVCALSFLFVSFAHALQHVDGIGAPASYELASPSGTDDVPDSQKSNASVEHCHACCGLTAILSDVTSLNAADTGQPAMLLLTSVRPHRPTFENPPPITSV